MTDFLQAYKYLYEGVEGEENYYSSFALEQYKNMLFEKQRKQVDFIIDLTENNEKILEIGTGNGRILLNLALEKKLRFGLGVDIAKTRIEFAQKWQKSLNIPQSKIQFKVEDTLKQPDFSLKFEVCLCLTGMFGYFDAIKNDEAMKLLEWISKNVLTENGILILETYNHYGTIEMIKSQNNSHYRCWSELGKDDPFQFILSDYSFNYKTNILRHKKIFLKRNDKLIDERLEELRIYSLTELKALIEGAGFAIQNIYADWDLSQVNEKNEKFIVVAKNM